MNNSKQIDVNLIGQSIKSLRLANNLTQQQLADLVGYSVRNIRRVENYGTNSIDLVNAFAEAFKVSAIDILKGCFLFVFNQSETFQNKDKIHIYIILLLHCKINKTNLIHN